MGAIEAVTKGRLAGNTWAFVVVTLYFWPISACWVARCTSYLARP